MSSSAKSTISLSIFSIVEALNILEDFFWNYFTDNYIELVKNRRQSASTVDSLSASTTLILILQNILKLFAPFVPMITDEIWSIMKPNEESIHLSKWPEVIDIEINTISTNEFEVAKESIASVRKEKTSKGIGLGKEVDEITITINSEKSNYLKQVLNDVKDASRAKKITINLSEEKDEISAEI